MLRFAVLQCIPGAVEPKSPPPVAGANVSTDVRCETSESRANSYRVSYLALWKNRTIPL